MTATVTASIASLILTIPVQTDYDTYEEGLPVGSEVIQDVATVKVWASTTSGFTPNDTNLVFAGKTLTIVIANLTPLTTYYLKYAFISEVDPDNIEYSAELSGTPNKIDGSIVVDGSVTTAQLAAGAVTTSKLSVQGRNMLTDIDSFEQYLGKAPPGSSGSATITTSQDFAYHGGWSLKHVSTASSSYKYLNPTGNNSNGWVRLEVGKVYIVSAYVRTTSASATSVALYAGPFEFGTTTAAGTAQTATLSISASQGWQRISVVISSVTGTNPAMRFYCRNSSSGITTYWDGFMIEERVGTDNTPSPFTPGGTTVIDGGNIVADTITASQITATAIRGKQLAGSLFYDAGTISTSVVNPPANVVTTTTLTVLDTTDFRDVGAGIVISALDASTQTFRYTGKTATTLTGVSGLSNQVHINDILLPIRYAKCQHEESYNGTDTYLSTNAASGYTFRQNGGTAIAFSEIDVADVFTYTSGQWLYLGDYYDALSGVSGLSGWSDGYVRYIVDNVGFPTTTISTAGNVTTLTINASNSLLSPTGGKLTLVSTSVVGWLTATYTAYSGTTITLDLSGVYFDTPATYYILPSYSNTVVGSDTSFISQLDEALGSRILLASASTGIETPFINAYARGNGLHAGDFSSVSSSVLSLTNTMYDTLHIALPPAQESDLLADQPIFCFGLVDLLAAPGGAPSNTLAAYTYYDSTAGLGKIAYLQNAQPGHYFSDPNSGTPDYILFDDTNNTYNFNADGGDGNAYIRAYHAALGNAAISSSAVINATQSMSVNATRYGMNNVLTITAATLTADRTIRGAYNSVQLQYQNAAAFSANAYGSYNEAATSTTSGNSLDGEGQLYGSFNYALHNTDDATYKRIEAAYGSYDHVYSAGDTSLIDNAYGVYAYVRTGGTAASATTAITTAYGIYGYVNASTANRNIGTAYLLYLTSGETGTVTTKWGVYVASTWPNFFNGNVILDGSVNYTPTVVTPAAAGTTTLTTGTSIVVCNHTATIASHTFTFPSTSLTNGQQITITARSAITTVTLSGGTFRGAITTLAAGGYAQYTYSSTAAAWFRTS